MLIVDCFSFPFEAMGSRCQMHLFSDDNSYAQATAELAMSEVHRIEARFSRYSSTSETSRINRAASQGSSVDVDVETSRLLNRAFKFYRISNGLFDITSGVFRRAWHFSSEVVPSDDLIRTLVPLVGMQHLTLRNRALTFARPGMELDFGGIAKEYAADRCALICKENGLNHSLIDLGGDLAVVGPLPDGQPWEIQIRHPRNSGESVAAIKVLRGGVATSGDYERFFEVNGVRYCHIINPTTTGFPVQGISSVTVVAHSCSMAGCLSTSAMLTEQRAESWLTKTCRLHAFMLTDGTCGGTLLGGCERRMVT
jgi:thiamine biosynthesis lipoprotein